MVMNEVFLVFVRIIKELTSDSLILNIWVRAHQHESDHSRHTLSKMHVKRQMMMVMNEVFLVFVRIKEMTSDGLLLNVWVRIHQHESDHSRHTLWKMRTMAANDDGNERSVPSVCEDHKTRAF